MISSSKASETMVTALYVNVNYILDSGKQNLHVSASRATIDCVVEDGQVVPRLMENPDNIIFVALFQRFSSIGRRKLRKPARGCSSLILRIRSLIRGTS